jgi:hypothetical protein
LRRLTEPARDAAFHATGHPVIEGYDPPEGWGWCYVDEVMLDLSERGTLITARSRVTIEPLSPGSQIREMRFAQVELTFDPATRLVLQLTVAIKIVDQRPFG